MAGTGLAEQIASHADGTPLGDLMTRLAAEIEQDRETLIDLMDRMNTPRNPVKQATAWVGEKASRLKFSGLSSEKDELGLFMSLEAMKLGVAGKLSLWKALAAVADQHQALAATDLDALIERAEAQHDTLERERMAAAIRTLGERASVPASAAS